MKKGSARKSSVKKYPSKNQSTAPRRAGAGKLKAKTVLTFLKKKVRKALIPQKKKTAAVPSQKQITTSEKISVKRIQSLRPESAGKSYRHAPAPDFSHLKALPFSYNETKLALLVRDTFWGYGYWDFSADTWNWIQGLYRRDAKTRSVLRIHNLDLRSYFDLLVQLEARNWYIEFGRPNTAYEAELGLIDSLGRFYRIALSNRIRTPRNAPSEVTDPHWEAADFDEIYALSGGGQTGRSSELFSRMKHLS